MPILTDKLIARIQVFNFSKFLNDLVLDLFKKTWIANNANVTTHLLLIDVANV